MATVSRVIELRGHIIDSLTFPKVLDEILDLGADYETEEISIGRTRRDTSRARIRVTAPSEEALDRVLAHVRRLGAEAVEERDAALLPAPGTASFPKASTRRRTCRPGCGGKAAGSTWRICAWTARSGSATGRTAPAA